MTAMLVLLLTGAEDVRDLANQWKRDYNEAVHLLDGGEPGAALPLAQRALGAAPPPEKNRVRALVVDAASKVGDRIAEFNALDPLLADPKADWKLFWNGSLDATADGYPASAYRYAMVAFERTPDKDAVAGGAFTAALAVDRIDSALLVLPHVKKDALIGPKSQLLHSLVDRGRCDDARRIANDFAPSGDAYAPLRRAAEACREP